jgi:hypothetical protein
MRRIALCHKDKMDKIAESILYSESLIQLDHFSPKFGDLFFDIDLFNYIHKYNIINLIIKQFNIINEF